MNENVYEDRLTELLDLLPSMTDAGVRAAYLANKSAPSDRWKSALAAECKARGIDI